MGGVLHPEEQEDFPVRVGQEELGRIFHLRHSLDRSEILIHHAERYRELGWLVEARTHGGEPLDFSHSSEVWAERLMTLILAGLEVGLAVRTGTPSGLLVLEVPPGDTLLDTYGEWRSSCRAVCGEEGEQHYFTLPGGSPLPVCRDLEDFQVQVYAQGGLVLVPPSLHQNHGLRWTWVSPPWETAPPPPPPPVWEFLEDFDLLRPPHREAGVLPWEEIYPRIAPHEKLMRALLTPARSLPAYYQEVARQARLAGIRDPEVLLALLWHAPQGDARTSPERLAFLKELVTAVLSSDDPGSPVGASPDQVSPPGPTAPPAMDLVEFMENKVILDRRRYESLIFELAELSARAEALERRLGEWERRFGLSSLASDPEVLGGGPPFRPGGSPKGLEPSIPDYSEKPRPPRQLRHVVQEFLQTHADLAQDPEAVRMLQFCLRNYIDLNPELNALPLGKKLHLAAQMARDFLRQMRSR